MTGMAGKRHSEESKRRMSLAKRRPLDGDLRVLARSDRMMVWEFQELVGSSEQMARQRLNRLVEAGYAAKSMPRGARCHTYVLTTSGANKLDELQVVATG